MKTAPFSFGLPRGAAANGAQAPPHDNIVLILVLHPFVLNTFARAPQGYPSTQYNTAS